MNIRNTATAFLALGVAGVLALSACASDEGEPMNDSNAQQPADAGQRSAEVIRGSFQTNVEGFTEAAGGTWTYMDGHPFSASDRESYMPQPCGSDDAGPQQLLLLLESAPRHDGPEEIETMRGKLEAAGLKITGFIPGQSAREASTVGARGKDGSQVTFSTNDIKSTLQFSSECSTHPSMNERLK